VNLKEPQGREIIYRLVRQSDVFLTNYRAGAIKRLGMDYQTLQALNPRVIYAHASGMGKRGPSKDDPVTDAYAMARGGMLLRDGAPGVSPTPINGALADRTTSIYTAYGILAALFARERHGFGQEVHTSELGSVIAMGMVGIAPFLLKGEGRPAAARGGASGDYLCKDGRWFLLSIDGNRGHDEDWTNLCRVVGMPDLENDPRFADRRARRENAGELRSVLEKVFLTRTAGEWYTTLKEVGDIQMTPYNSWATVAEDPQVLANDYIAEWDHPDLGPTKWVGFPVEYSRTPAGFIHPAPQLGQHTAEVLQEIGYSEEEIKALDEQRVIRLAADPDDVPSSQASHPKYRAV
jgi:crotonobetainyl-CoA:carnitine CoA-transferase CaiB-like acyl-CoA transferase